MIDTNDLIRDFPLEKLGIEIDLNIFTDPAGQLLLEPHPKPEDLEKYGEERIMYEVEVVFHDIFQEAVNKVRGKGRK